MENFKIIQEKENPLFDRKEIEFEISSEIAPSKTEIEKLAYEKLSAPEGSIKVKQILGGFGSKDFKIVANVYKSKEDLEKTEFKSKKEKEAEAKQKEEAKKKAEEEKAQAEQKVEEKPKEESTPTLQPTETPKEEIKTPEQSNQ